MEPKTFKIIRHLNPSGKTTWYRAVYCDEQRRIHKSPVYGHAPNSTNRRRAQSWLYANIHVWCKTAHVEQRVVTSDGKSQIIFIRQEEII